MSTIPPAPPPPSLPDINITTKQTDLAQNTQPNIDPDICQWAIEYPELREACIKSGICVNKPPYMYKYKKHESIKQVGPTCGLVALSMYVDGEVTPDELMSIAKLEGYTSNGEMFSCKQMVKLAEKALSLSEIENVCCKLKHGGLYSSETVHRLINGALLLVPYDADFNHSPCLRNGFTAHWAIVCGVLIVDQSEEDYTSDSNNIYVLCKHGKSQYLAIWNLSNLANSNHNLHEFSPKKGADGLVYVLPIGGIGGINGLRDQFLMFESY